MGTLICDKIIDMKKIMLLTVVGLLLVISSFAQPAVTAYNEGIKLEDQKKYTEALASFKKAISLNPNYKEALFQAGWCCNELEKYSDALSYLQKAKQFMSGEAKVYLEMGYANQKLKRDSEAKANFEKCLSLKSDYALAYKYLGNLYYDQDEYEKALQNYESYVENESDVTSSLTMYRKGYCENEQAKYSAAVQSLKKAVSLDDQYTDAYNELGYAYTKLKNSEDAISAYNDALRINSKSYVALNGLGDVYRNVIKDNNEAMKYYFRTLAIKPDNKKANYSIGWCYNDKEKYNDAVPYLKKALEADNNYVSALTELGYSDYSLENYDDALKQFNKAISIEKTELSLYYSGLCYVGLKQKGNAQRMLNELRDMNSDYADKLKKKVDGM